MSSTTEQGAPVPDDVDLAGMARWLIENVPELVEPVGFRLVPGGRSNLTFLVTDARGHVVVVRRPPAGGVIPRAHDMAREVRILRGVASADVPAPTVIAHCEDLAAAGAPFYVMSFVDALAMRTPGVVESLSDESLSRIPGQLVQTMFAIHDVDLGSAGLADLGPGERYVERQLHGIRRRTDPRWIESYPDLDRTYRLLVDSIPEQRETVLVHGDYRMDNCLFTPEGTVAAVLDWELCTLGDARADLGLLIVWSDPDPLMARIGATPETLLGFPPADQLRALYTDLPEARLEHLDYFVSLGYWKLASLMTNVAGRYEAGVMGQDGADRSSWAECIRVLSERAHSHARGVSRTG